MATTAIAHRRGRFGLHPVGPRSRQKARTNRRELPEYLEQSHIEALIRHAPHHRARMLILIMWRAGLRVSEACRLDIADVDLDADHPALRVRQGKGQRTRVTPIHPELAGALRTFQDFAERRTGPVLGVHRSTAWSWVKTAVSAAVDAGDVPAGRHVGNHTFRHSAARHWLASGVPINVVSRWLGHRNLSTTLIYLEILPVPLGDMAKVP